MSAECLNRSSFSRMVETYEEWCARMDQTARDHDKAKTDEQRHTLDDLCGPWGRP